MVRHILVIEFTLLALFALACGDTPKDPADFKTPNILNPVKDDGIGDTVNINGRISFGDEVFGEFVEDKQLEGWFFTAAAGSVVTIDNSNFGTSRNLDSTLFLYGPKQEDGFYGYVPIAFDDDSGWGSHARIKEFGIPEDGEYLIVMGTYLNIDRGRFRLALLCKSDSCIVACDDDCPSGDQCSTKVCDEIDGCIDSEPDPSCGDSHLVVSKSQVMTSEDNESDSFTLKMSAPPSNNLIVWVTSSNFKEAVVYPLKVFFCMDGYAVTYNGCIPVDTSQISGEPGWKKGMEITVTGVHDFVSDGDTEYSIRFDVQEQDSGTSEFAPQIVSGINLDSDATLDYSSLDGLSDDELLDALFTMVDGHRAYNYLGINSARTIMFSVLDLHDGWVESIYDGSKTEMPRDASQAYAQGFNTEHTWPQAQFGKQEPMKSDLHHIFPTDTSSNSSRSNYDYGWTANRDDLRSILGTNDGQGASKVFQVRPERRGDVARAHFYMAVRYKRQTIKGLPFDDDTNSNNGCINNNEEEVLREWNAEDPVDDLERERNNIIQAYQGNRNPFIDMPELVEHISDF